MELLGWILASGSDPCGILKKMEIKLSIIMIGPRQHFIFYFCY